MNISRTQLTETLRKVYLFHALNNEQMDTLMSGVDLVFFPAGKMIFLENTIAEAYYIVYDGQVEILREKDHALLYKNIINPLFGFGEDIFADSPRKTSARALNDVILIKIKKDSITSIAEKNAAFHQLITQQYSSYNYLVSSRYTAMPDETLCFISQPHPIAVISKMIFLLLGFLAVGILLFYFRGEGLFNNRIFQWILAGLSLGGIAWFLYLYFEWSNDYFFFTNKRVSSMQRAYLIFEERRESPLSAIESIEVRKNIFGRALDYGDLDVNTYTGSTLIHQVPDIENVQKMLQFLTRLRRGMEDQEAKDAFRDDLFERLHPSAEKTSSLQQEDDEKTNENETVLKSITNEEIEKQKSDELIFRKHITVLFSKAFIPVLLILSHLLFYIFVRINGYSFGSSKLFTWVMAVDILLLSLWAIYRYMDWNNDRFIVTDNLLIDIDRKPFGTEEKRSAPIERIQSIRYKKKGIFGLLFNFGTVFIRIGDEEFTFDDLFRPAEVTQIIFDARESLLDAENKTKQEADHKRALDWIEAYHHLQNEDGKNNQEIN